MFSTILDFNLDELLTIIQTKLREGKLEDAIDNLSSLVLLVSLKITKLGEFSRNIGEESPQNFPNTIEQLLDSVVTRPLIDPLPSFDILRKQASRLMRETEEQLFSSSDEKSPESLDLPQTLKIRDFDIQTIQEEFLTSFRGFEGNLDNLFSDFPSEKRYRYFIALLWLIYDERALITGNIVKIPN